MNQVLSAFCKELYTYGLSSSVHDTLVVYEKRAYSRLHSISINNLNNTGYNDLVEFQSYVQVQVYLPKLNINIVYELDTSLIASYF